MSAYHEIAGQGGAPVLLVSDHASNHVPHGIDLGIDPALLDEHIAVDLGAGDVTRAVAALLGAPALLGGVSRLVIDLNREPEAGGLIPAESDGRRIPGNAGLLESERDRRIALYHQPYHSRVEALIDTHRPALVVSIHSFTPQLLTRPDVERPWPVGLLYNVDERAARIAIMHLRAAGHLVGDNEPYSGRELNYTMDRHAEPRGLPYLGFELRQDEIGDPAGVARWSAIVADTVGATLAALAAAAAQA
ncbi:MAG: N-formylglutamate amidohydrolase [Alphaproteobacteria bacterium]|nr:N-formylglutamate amidohydrolase [Alphaproteobacteria bacterium]